MTEFRKMIDSLTENNSCGMSKELRKLIESVFEALEYDSIEDHEILDIHEVTHPSNPSGSYFRILTNSGYDDFTFNIRSSIVDAALPVKEARLFAITDKIRRNDYYIDQSQQRIERLNQENLVLHAKLRRVRMGKE